MKWVVLATRLVENRLTCTECARSIGHGTHCVFHGGEPMPKHVIAALRQKRQAGDEVVETVIGTVEAPDNLHAEGKAHKIFGFHVTVRSAIEHQFVLEERSAAKRSTRPKPAHAKRA